MKNKKLKVLTAVLSLTIFSFLSVSVALAAVTGVGPTDLPGVTTLVDRIVVWFQGLVFLLGVLMIVWAGLIWITAGGDEEKLKNARSRLIWGLIGIGVALFAGVAKDFVTSLLTI